MSAAHDMTMHWPSFTSRERLRSDIESVISAKTEQEAFGLLMGVTIGAYVLVEKQRQPGEDVREAAKRARGAL